MGLVYVGSVVRSGSAIPSAVHLTSGIWVRLPEMDVVPHARTLGERAGFMKALVAAESDRILGCAVPGAQSGEVMAVVQMAMLGELPYTMPCDGMLAHPTMAERLGMLFAKLQSAAASCCG